MSIIHGSAGSLKKGEIELFGLTGWRVEVELETIDMTPMGSSWKEPEAALAGFLGEFTCLFDLTDAGQKALHDTLAAASPTGEVADMKFYVDQTRYYGARVLITSFRVAASADEVVKIVFQFVGQGELTPPDFS